MVFQKGAKNIKWKNGTTITKKGYVRITAGEHRDKLEHRVVVENLMLTDPRFNRELAPDEEVHHLDWNRAHNCPQNLLMFQEVIHDAIASDNIENHVNKKRRRKRRGR